MKYIYIVFMLSSFFLLNCKEKPVIKKNKKSNKTIDILDEATLTGGFSEVITEVNSLIKQADGMDQKSSFWRIEGRHYTQLDNNDVAKDALLQATKANQGNYHIGYATTKFDDFFDDNVFVEITVSMIKSENDSTYNILIEHVMREKSYTIDGVQYCVEILVEVDGIRKKSTILTNGVLQYFPVL